MKNGRRNHVSPGARSWTMVAIVLIEPSSDDRISRHIPASQNVWPIVAKSASGGYDLHPELGAPCGEKKLAIITIPPTRYSQ